jgi:hypothetical protein
MHSSPHQFWKAYQHLSESYREEDVLVWFQQEAIPLEKKKAKRNVN